MLTTILRGEDMGKTEELMHAYATLCMFFSLLCNVIYIAIIS
jgi:hypothetical protein